MKFYEVFKAGKYPQGKFSLAEVEELANNYDPSFCEAPITLDHEQKGPAYGWVESLKADNGVLKATFKDLSDDLKDFVQAGKYKKISVEIYRELEDKKPYLKAVSFLGASIPQVKGMASVEFKEGESEIYTFEVEPEVEDTKTEDETESIDELKATVADLEKQIADFRQTSKKNTEVKELKSQVKNLSSELAKFKDEAQGKDELAKELHDLKNDLRNKEFSEFIDKQIDAGVLTPANKDAVFNILQGLNAWQCVKFGQSENHAFRFDQMEPFYGDVGTQGGSLSTTGADNVNKFESSNGVELFKSFVSTLPKQVEFDEIAKKKTTSKVSVEKYADADDESKEIFKEASELAEKENISFKDALLKIKDA